MAGAGKKTFTAGETLTASDMNNFVMDQTVMYFAGTAARASAIPTPSTGMTSYIGVTGTATIPQLETYTGSAWQTPYGLTLLASANLSGASFTVANVFSAAYDAYQVVFTNVIASNTANITLSFPSATSGYYSAVTYVAYGGSTVSGASQNNASNFESQIIMRTTIGSGGTTTIYNPFLTTSTVFTSQGADNRIPSSGGAGVRYASGFLDTATSYTDLVIGGGGQTFLGGKVRIYGLRNS